jgi:O-antigen/teichoic acid export membrane protein
MSSASLKARWHSLFPAGSLRARFATGAFWTMAGQALAQAFTAMTAIIIARILGAERYGALAIVTSTIAMFNVMAELSLGMTTNKHVAEYRKSDPARAGRIIALGTMMTFCTGLLMALAVIAFARPLATFVLEAPEIAPYLQLGAPMLLFSAINGVQIGTLSGYENFRTINVGRILMAVLALPLVVSGVLLRGIPGILVAQIVLSLIGLIWFRAALVRQSRVAGVIVSYRDAWRERQLLWSFALPSMLASLMYMPVIWVGNALLVRSPNGLAEMGKFNAANHWRTLIIWVPGAIGQVALPILTSLLSEGDRTRFMRALKVNVGINLLLGLSFAVPLSLCSYWIMGLYGAEFSERWLALVMLCGAGALHASMYVIAQVIASTSRMWWGFVFNALWGVELLVIAWFLVRYGADGLAMAYFFAYFLLLLKVAAYATWILRYDTRLTPANMGSIEFQSAAAAD